MNFIELTELQTPNNCSLRISPNGRYITFQGSDGLTVIDFESQPVGHIARYVLSNKVASPDHESKVAFYEDYIVVVQLNTQNQLEGYLELLRFDFRIGEFQQLKLQFPNITLNDSCRPKQSFYPGLPAKACELFKSDFFYFHDNRLGVFFSTDKLVVEYTMEHTDYQLFDVSNSPKCLLSYESKEMISPFTMTYVVKQTQSRKYHLLKYKKGRCFLSHIMVLHYLTKILNFCEAIYCIHQPRHRRILMKSRTKTLRTFRLGNFCNAYIHSYYIVSHNIYKTVRIDMMSALQVTLQCRGHILRGKYIFDESINLQETYRQVTVTIFE